MQFDVVLSPENLLLYGHGLLITLELLIASLIFGAVCALPLSLLRASANLWLSRPVWLFTYILRGTPLLLQVYLIYYGVAQLPWIQARWNDIWPWTWFKGPLFCTVLAFGINTTAYTIEILAGALKATAAGEIEAAASLGMRPGQRLLRIILPSALRRSLPAYGNEVILMLQATSVASVVPSLIDLTAAAGSIYATYYLPFEAYLVAGAIYLVLTFMLIGLLRWVERHFVQPMFATRH
jgi:arginine/ornithine transport system permease protein